MENRHENNHYVLFDDFGWIKVLDSHLHTAWTLLIMYQWFPLSLCFSLMHIHIHTPNDKSWFKHNNTCYILHSVKCLFPWKKKANNYLYFSIFRFDIFPASSLIFEKQSKHLEIIKQQRTFIFKHQECLMYHAI